MKIVLAIGSVLGVILVIAAVYAGFQKGAGELERTVLIERPSEMVYAQVSNLKNFNNWSPWFTIDPETKYSYEGPESGAGAKMSWESDHPDVGAGSQWILGIKENKEVNLQLDFGFAGGYYSDMILEETGEGTKVTWVYRYEDLDLMGKFFTAMMGAEQMVADSYEKGLQDLKAYVEAQPMPVPALQEVDMEADSTLSM